ncbi:MAG: glycoside hydrolase family 9 protein [Ruminococcus sp.]|nr:glycoside hydrolase family 9 protein [Ruminococcus sp.]
MHNKISKAIVGSLMSAAMLATAVTSVIAPMSASAGQQLGQTDFTDGTGLPWHTCETNPAKQKFEIKDGAYHVEVVNENGSDGRWDLQLRHRGLKIEAGHTYEISGEVTCDKAGYIYAKVGNYAGNVELWHNISGQEWQPAKLEAGKTLSFSDTFTAKETLEIAEWAFHYANNNGRYGNNDTGCPAGAKLVFDNLSLIDTTSDDNDFDETNEFGVIRPQSNVRLNQVGYYSNLNKKASYVTDASSPLDWELRDSSGKAVLTGKTTVFGEDPDSGTSKTSQIDVGTETRTRYKDSGANVHIIDFSEYKPGDELADEEYTIFVKDATGVSGTQSGILKGAFDTTVSGDKVEWENWKTGKTYTMNESHPFKINNYIYSGLVTNALNYYYQNRSGIPIEAAYITSGDKTTLAHSEYGHGKDVGYVQPEWVKSYTTKDEVDTKYSVDATGGWYDAGDHGKYVVNGGVSVWTLQNMYEWSKHQGTEAKWTDDKTMIIPENGNNKPDVLEEARVELDWMFKMMVDSKDPYYGKNAGLVYHKMHDYKWTGLGIHAWEYEGFEDILEGGRIVKPPTYAATLNMVACAAQAARLWEGIDDAYAAECLKNAEIGYEAVINSGDDWKVAEGDGYKNPLFAPLDQAIGGGAYGDSYVYDDMYWAACELYATTGEAKYKEMLESYSNPNDSTKMDKAYSLTSNLGGGENKGSLSSFNWGCTSGLGTLSLYLNSDKLDADAAKQVSDSIIAAGDVYTEEQANQGMGIPYHGSTFTDPINIGDEVVTGYEWGSNSFVINNAIVMAYAFDASGDMKYMNGAAEALDYIFGRNGNDFSYVSGYGDRTLEWPHHRFWANGIDPAFPKVPAGVMSGGPGAGMQDPYVGGLGYKRGTLASQKIFVDNAESWSTNEITINWNAPLSWMSAFMDDEGANPTAVNGNGTPGITNPPTPGTTNPPTPGTPGGTATLWGDANCDGKVTIADATAILQSLGNSDEFSLTEQGAINADVIDNGGGLSAADAVAIQAVDAAIYGADKFPMTTAEYEAAIK